MGGAYLEAIRLYGQDGNGAFDMLVYRRRVLKARNYKDGSKGYFESIGELTQNTVQQKVLANRTLPRTWFDLSSWSNVTVIEPGSNVTLL